MVILIPDSVISRPTPAFDPLVVAFIIARCVDG